MLLKPEFIAGKLRTCFILKYFGKKYFLNFFEAGSAISL